MRHPENPFSEATLRLATAILGLALAAFFAIPRAHAAAAHADPKPMAVLEW
jgi:hypothetical protein